MWTSQYRRPWGVVSLVFACSLSAAAQTGPDPASRDLFRANTSTDRPGVLRGEKRRRAIELNRDALSERASRLASASLAAGDAAPPLAFNFFDESTPAVVVDDTRVLGNGRTTWTGRFKGDPLGSWAISASPESIVGEFRWGSGRWVRFNADASGAGEVIELSLIHI